MRAIRQQSWLAAGAIALAAALSLAQAPGHAVAATTTVQVGQQNGGVAAAFQFNAASVAVSSGDTVHWALFSGFHTVTSFAEPSPGVPQWSSGTFPFDHAFGPPGTYTYYCSIHATRAQADPSVIDANIAGGAMVGKVVVTAPASVGGIAEAPDAAALAPRDGGGGIGRGRVAVYVAALAAAAAGAAVARRLARRPRR